MLLDILRHDPLPFMMGSAIPLWDAMQPPCLLQVITTPSFSRYHRLSSFRARLKSPTVENSCLKLVTFNACLTAPHFLHPDSYYPSLYKTVLCQKKQNLYHGFGSYSSDLCSFPGARLRDTRTDKRGCIFEVFVWVYKGKTRQGDSQG